jgi:hypothetical protein
MYLGDKLSFLFIIILYYKKKKIKKITSQL